MFLWNSRFQQTIPVTETWHIPVESRTCNCSLLSSVPFQPIFLPWRLPEVTVRLCIYVSHFHYWISWPIITKLGINFKPLKAIYGHIYICYFLYSVISIWWEAQTFEAEATLNIVYFTVLKWCMAFDREKIHNFKVTFCRLWNNLR
jgi:hypothetical protein